MLPPLVLTGAPAVGKTVTALRIARRQPRCAVIDVDDIRQLVVTGAVAPWQGTEGGRQQRLGITNACALANNFLANDVNVIIADVLTPSTAEMYRRSLPGCLIVHLMIARAEAVRRFTARTVRITDAEFAALHEADATNPPDADIRLQVDDLDVNDQASAVAARWTSA